MSEEHTQCDDFTEVLIEAGSRPEIAVPPDHLESCPECRAQWETHQMLAMTLAEQEVPELSPGFGAGLDRKLESIVEIRPLRGWKMAAMLGYAVAALGVLALVLRDVPMPTVDPSSPWLAAAAFLAVPLTLMMAISASRWIPGAGRPRALRMLTL